MPATGKPRIQSIDLLRGVIMIIMALDHVRDYLLKDSFYYDPLDLQQTSGVLFLTRWITHFCAPVFMLLAGVSAYLIGQKKTKRELSVFLLKRGLWLIVLEMLVVNFGWNFNPAFPMFLFVTIWALGVCMVALAGLIYLPAKWLLILCMVLIAGHNLFDTVQVNGNSMPAFGWALLHQQNFFTWHKEILLVGYPILPWLAVMPLGYLMGQWYATGYDTNKRRMNLLMVGASAVVLFVLLRYSNSYGDPVKWTSQSRPFFSFFSFIKVNKYPPSLLYLLITLGPALLFLAFTEKWQGAVINVITVYGRVPMFYYLIHIYLIHFIALLASALTPGQDWHMWILTQPIWFSSNLKGYGFSLPVTYLVWVGVVVFMFPLCKRYDAYKREHKEKWWLSYL